MNSPTHLSNIQWHLLRGSEIEDFLVPLGELRIDVFREWPYLYEGDLDYEKKYLRRYSQALHSLAVLVFDQGQLVGASTAIDLLEEEPAFRDPFQGTDFDLVKGVYFAESILRAPYRGLGWGKRFMTERLRFAQELPGKSWVTFCSVLRPDSHPLKPENVRDLKPFWRSVGFAEAPGIKATFNWKDLDQPHETAKELQFWTRSLDEKEKT